jgi:GNAT superfamily N-acetyltransferase
MESEIDISTVDLSEKKILLDLLSQQFAEHHISVCSNDLEKSIAAVFDNENLGFFLVAKKEDVIIGMAYISFNWTLEHCGRSAWLEELYVVPPYRNHGVGQKLLSSVIQQARASGCVAIDLEVDQSHAQAENLYRRAGFNRLSRTRWVKDLSIET